MQIYLNGEIRELSEQTTVEQLLALLELTGKRLAVEINASVMPRSQFASYQLAAGDRVEIVHAIGGG